MTGEVRLVGDKTPNLPEAATMAAVAAEDCGPFVVDRLGAVRLKSVCRRQWRTPEVCLDVGVAGCRRGRSEQRGCGGLPVGRPSARLLEARGMSGAHRLPGMPPGPKVSGAGRKPKVVVDEQICRG